MAKSNSEQVGQKLKQILDSTHFLSIPNDRHIHIRHEGNNFDFLIVPKTSPIDPDNLKESIKQRIKTNATNNIYTGIIQYEPWRLKPRDSPRYNQTDDVGKELRALDNNAYSLTPTDEIIVYSGQKTTTQYIGKEIVNNKITSLKDSEGDERGDFFEFSETQRFLRAKIFIEKKDYNKLVVLVADENPTGKTIAEHERETGEIYVPEETKQREIKFYQQAMLFSTNPFDQTDAKIDWLVKLNKEKYGANGYYFKNLKRRNLNQYDDSAIGNLFNGVVKRIKKQYKL